jgi:hypothetical protein
MVGVTGFEPATSTSQKCEPCGAAMTSAGPLVTFRFAHTPTTLNQRAARLYKSMRIRSCMNRTPPITYSLVAILSWRRSESGFAASLFLKEL